MNYLNLAMTFYMQHPALNTLILTIVLVLGVFIWIYKKVYVLALIGSMKAEMRNFLKGKDKLEYALSWVMKQNFYKNSILKFIPQKLIRWIINATFNKNKEIIKTK